jgi:electron transport protein HydN
VVACPFGAVEIIETAELLPDGTTKRIANKCDLCKGFADTPSCVRVCPTDALLLVSENALEAGIAAKRAKSVAAASVTAPG